MRGSTLEVWAVVFEGGRAASPVEKDMERVRNGVVLDTIERLLDAPSTAGVVLCSDRDEVLGEARRLGAQVRDTGAGRFHFGRTLASVIEGLGAGAVICLSGAAAPLFTTEDFEGIARRLRARSDIVVMNNVLSADVIGFRPASAIRRLRLPDTDNFFGYLLREAGLERVLLQNSARVNFDIDTPADVLLLKGANGVGPRAASAVRGLGWDATRVDRAVDGLRSKGCRVFVAGRVNPVVMNHVNMTVKCRLRALSEERGMKALGLDRRGEVRSLLAVVVDALGPDGFFSWLSEAADVAVIDTRVMFAAWNPRTTAHDRFNSDLGRYQVVQDDKVRGFSKAAAGAPFPVILGGHSLVSGGLWLLADRASEP